MVEEQIHNNNIPIVKSISTLLLDYFMFTISSLLLKHISITRQDYIIKTEKKAWISYQTL